MAEYSYSVNEDTRTLTIWEDNAILATVEDVGPEEAVNIMADIVYEMRGIAL